jgi:CheY-like chemotaxis protein
MALIVTVDDHDDVRAVMERSLQRAGHTVITAADGLAGLDSVRQHHPDIVITDVEMPRMNGLELCRAITQDRDLQHIPVMLVSGSIRPNQAVPQCAGVAAVMSKPFAPKKLVETVAGLLAAGASVPRPLLERDRPRPRC